MGTEIEALAIGNCYLQKEVQDPSKKVDYSGDFELD
jgi:carbamoyltransferase